MKQRYSTINKVPCGCGQVMVVMSETDQSADIVKQRRRIAALLSRKVNYTGTTGGSTVRHQQSLVDGWAYMQL